MNNAGVPSILLHLCSVLRAQCVPLAWPVGQVVKTGASHAPIGSSTLPRVTISLVGENLIVGVDDSEGPPVPIPNTEVKLTGGEDT